MNSKTLWRWDKNIDTSIMQEYRRLRIVDQKIQESKWLCIGLKSRKTFGNISVPSFIGRKKINSEAILGNIASDIFLIYVRNWPKCFIYILKQVEHWGNLLLNCNGNILELRYVYVYGLKNSMRKSRA